MSFAIGTLLLFFGTYLIGRNRQVAVRLGLSDNHPADWHLSTSVARQNIATVGLLALAAGLAMMFLF